MVQLHAIRTALNIDIPPAQIVNVVTEANRMLGLPASDGTLPVQVCAICAFLGV